MTKSELENCILKYGTEIYSFCRNITFNLQEADDLFQDTFLKAMELIDEIDYEKNPKSYLLSVAFKLWKNKKRKHAWRNRIANILPLTDAPELESIEPFAFSPEQELLKKEESTLVRQAVNGLAEKYKADLPIIEQVNAALFQNKPVKEAVYELMTRDKKAENDELAWEA